MKKIKKKLKKQPKQLKQQTKATPALVVAVEKAEKAKTAPKFPGAEDMADAVWHLNRVVNKAVQQMYDRVLSQTIIKLQHARRKSVIR